ncbi:sensor histidine kinase [Nonomuraea terrae]|uniref:sensor histidine kinase n=1 Tax=Nonomuraea terrae TaxID=2530383 RepID=UPI001404E580|nr:ATP-binding protein [Nonomuraea terrae]
MKRALGSFAVTAFILCGAGAWALAQISPVERTLVMPGGIVVFAIASGAVAVAAYFAATAGRWRERSHRIEAAAGLLERDIRSLTEGTLPELWRRQTSTVPDVLAKQQRPSHPEAKRLLHALGQVLDRERSTRASALAACSAMQDELGKLADEQLPALVQQMRVGDGAAEITLTEVKRLSQPAVQHLWVGIARELEAANRQGAAAMVACASVAARIQADVTETLAYIQEREHQYGKQPDIFADLLELDHQITRLGRLADNIAVLAGGRTGRRWPKPIGMESVLRGAIGRIAAYRRVETHSTSTAAVEGYAAEGVIHVLAELIDNATSFSPPSTSVHVYVEEEDAGIVITIEDSGLGMRSRERRIAEDLVSQPMDLATLSGTRLGLAVVGRLAGKYGLGVNFRPSSRGGVGVVTLIPRQMIVYPHTEEPLTGQESSRALTDFSPPAPRHQIPPTADGELPRRPRGETLRAAAPAASTPATTRPASDSGAAARRLAAFARGSARPEPSSPPPPPQSREDD